MPLPGRDRAVVIAFTNQKGGCGKTTTTVSVAAGLAKLGHICVVADTDPQCNATDSFGLDRDQLTADSRFTVADAYLAEVSLREIVVPFPNRFEDRLGVVPGHRGLSTVPQRLETEIQTIIANQGSSDIDADDMRNEHRFRLKRSMDNLAQQVDFILIDTPPDLGFLMTTALIAADYFVIPVFPSGYDLKGLETLMRTTEKVQKRLNPQLQLLGVVLGNFDGNARLDNDIQTMLRGQFGDGQVFETTISRSVKHREAPLYGRSIFEHAPNQSAAQQFAQLSREFATKVGINGGQVPSEEGQSREVTHG
jgi:chromosome partitioning protein